MALGRVSIWPTLSMNTSQSFFRLNRCCAFQLQCLRSISTKQSSKSSLKKPNQSKSTETIPITLPTKNNFTRYIDPSIYDHTRIPKVIPIQNAPESLHITSTVPVHIRPVSVPITLYSFPTFTPLSLLEYPSTHLKVPLRRDILHRAVIFEGDAARRGTASTKHRSEVIGSGRKLRPQKGTGKARLGNKKSPMLKGGGVAHGPKPRDFSTKLPRKLYDQAWRCALSYRYKRGELVVVDTLWGDNITKLLEEEEKEAGVEHDEDNGAKRDLRDARIAGFTDIWKNVEGHEEMEDGSVRSKRSVWITSHNEDHPDLKIIRRAMALYHPGDKIKTIESVDVKNLLELERIVVEKVILDKILENHQSDLKPAIDIGLAKEQAENDSVAMAEAVEQMKAIAEEEARSQTLHMEGNNQKS